MQGSPRLFCCAATCPLLQTDAEVIPVDDDAAIETTRFEFVPIESIQKVEPNEFVDVIGVLVGVGPLTHITSKAGRDLNKRSITLLDKTLCQVEVTLWGEQAEKYDEVSLPVGSVVAIKACKVSDFGGRSLSSSFQSQLFLNPDHSEAHQLRGWYDANGSSLTDLQNISKQSRGSEGGPAGAAGNQRKELKDIVEQRLGFNEKVSGGRENRHCGLCVVHDVIVALLVADVCHRASALARFSIMRFPPSARLLCGSRHYHAVQARLGQGQAVVHGVPAAKLQQEGTASTALYCERGQPRTAMYRAGLHSVLSSWLLLPFVPLSLCPFLFR